MKWSSRFSTRSLYQLIYLCSIIFPVTGLCADPVLEPGEYRTESGDGTLKIVRGDNGKLTFSIYAVGSNLHTCELEGEIISGRAVMKPYEAEEACTVMFEPAADEVTVTPQENGGCRMFCGARAGFGGEYLKLAKGCDSDSVAQSREKFKVLYGRKSFADAHTILATLLANCEKTIHRFELGWIRNDLAITQYHLGRPKDCLKTLEPLADDAKLTDQQLEESLGVAPADADIYLPIVRAARTNLKSCGQLANSKQ